MHAVFATCDAKSAPSDSHYQHNNTRSTTLTTNIKVFVSTIQECQIVSRLSGCLEDCKSSTRNHVCPSLTSRLLIAIGICHADPQATQVQCGVDGLGAPTARISPHLRRWLRRDIHCRSLNTYPLLHTPTVTRLHRAWIGYVCLRKFDSSLYSFQLILIVSSLDGWCLSMQPQSTQSRDPGRKQLAKENCS